MSKVCFFGIFDPAYARNRVLIRGFKENGYEVTLCRVDPKKCGGITKYFKLIGEYRKIRKEKFEHVIVAFPGHTVAWLAYVLFGRKIIFDVFVSLHNSEIEDREAHGRFSFRAMWYWMLDWTSMRLPKTLLIDTKAHRDFIAHKFGISQEKFVVVYVGSDDKVVYPVSKEKDDNSFVVHFHGSGIPLQGIEYIIGAADILKEENMSFVLYGNLQSKSFKDAQRSIKEKELSRIELKPAFPYEEMSTVLSKADVVLGIFGDTVKANLVIPNKAYEAWASKKLLITRKSQAMDELVQDGQHVVLCNPADPKDLAKKIINMKNDTIKRYSMAEKGYEMYQKILYPLRVVHNLLQQL